VNRPTLKTLVIATFCGGLVASVSLNVWLTMKVMDYKGRLFLARQFPDDVGARIEPDSRSTILLVGDSRIHQWSLPDTPKRRHVNRGVSGYTAREALTRLRLDLAAAPKLDAIVIQVGVNDILSAGYNRRSRLPSSSLEGAEGRPEPAQIMESALQNLRILVEEARRAAPRVFVFSLFPTGPIGYRDLFFWDAEMEAHLAQMNTGIKGLADGAVEIVDTEPLLATPDSGRGNPENYTDAYHLNARGYQILTQALDSRLGNLP
jgi:lysophospholipase L1-like esterase